jgi:hypothetical protein
MSTPDTVRVVIPLKLKRRNGRPRILPPDDIQHADDDAAQDPHLVRAIARAWNWRRKLEQGELTTIEDIAAAEKVTSRFVGRTLRLAYLSPVVLEKLLVHRRPCALSIKALMGSAELPWAEQEKHVLGE